MRFVVDYAFREMNLHRVSLEVFEGNDRAKKVYDKVSVFFRHSVALS
jgi:RimJ/RimL family protein N-acetyltransferase